MLGQHASSAVQDTASSFRAPQVITVADAALSACSALSSLPVQLDPAPASASAHAAAPPEQAPEPVNHDRTLRPDHAV